jgi:Tfp pilus assembly protein PilP
MTMVNKRLCALAVLLIPALLACDDEPPPPPPGPAGGGPVQGPPPAPEVKPQPQMDLTEADFMEGPSNRDPFRSFLAEFKPIAKKLTRDERKIILPRYGLDELKLIAVVTGGAVRPRAMFRDPTGLGVTVKRGDRISKNAGKIKRILRDRIVVEIEEQSEDRSQTVERVIELHPKEEREKESEEATSGGEAPAPEQE